MTFSELGRKKFLGSLLGAALGASWEGNPTATEQEIRYIARVSNNLRYTDDTHMTIGVAESLVACRGFNGAHMAELFASNYFKEPWRGYGPGPPQVFCLLRNGEAWDEAAAHIYPGGSFGNGAAMRVAPIGLFFWNRPDKLKEVAYQASLITHSHLLGMEGAAIQAMAVALAYSRQPVQTFDTVSFVTGLLSFTTDEAYREKIAKFVALLENAENRERMVQELGHGIEAINSVPTAIFSFLAHYSDFEAMSTYAISLGGDTDTIASMAGAISGTYLGIDGLPPQWLEQLENKNYISDLAGRLWQVAQMQS